MAKHSTLRLPPEFAVYYRTTLHGKWKPAEYSWCFMRDYYYENGKSTGKHTLEVSLHIKSDHYGKQMVVPHSLFELDQYDFDCLGFEFINQSVDI